MKFVHFNDFRLGVLAGEGDERVVDITDLVGAAGSNPRDRMEALIAGWAELAPALRDAVSNRPGVSIETVQLRASVPKPGQLVCAAGNYLEPASPEIAPFNGFLKATSSIIGTGDTVVFPDAPATVFHFEPELALVISKAASHLKPEEAMDHVFGYTQYLDVSSRGLPGGFFLGKSWHTFAPLGPALVTADEVPEPNALDVTLSVDGKTRHTYSTSNMARRIPELLAAITKVMALEPGDVVACGVHHADLTPIQNGNHVRLVIQGFGPALEVTVQDPLNRTWE